MQTITFTCETITPMFLAGADGQTPELRAPSIKGALRFWWRAMNGHLPLEELKERESEIFGGTDNRSKVAIRVRHEELKFSTDFRNSYKVETYEGKYKGIDILLYAAYGHTEYKKEKKKTELIHSFIPPKTKFDVIFKFITEEYQTEIIKAFKVLSIYGGLGSKSRNGFGGFRILSPTSLPPTLISDLITKDKERASYSAFSRDAILYKVIRKDEDEDEDSFDGFDSWDDALGWVMSDYQIARTSIENWHSYSNRLHIAQPIEVKHERISNFLERHSKSIFVKIQYTKEKFIPRILFMPYNYLAGNEKFSSVQQDKLSEYNKIYKDFLEKFMPTTFYSPLT